RRAQQSAGRDRRPEDHDSRRQPLRRRRRALEQRLLLGGRPRAHAELRAGRVKPGKVNPNVMGLDDEVKNSTFTDKFKAAYPDRFVDCYIAEQNMAGAALGLASEGKIPFASTFACFLSRAFDQIRMAG